MFLIAMLQINKKLQSNLNSLAMKGVDITAIENNEPDINGFIEVSVSDIGGQHRAYTVLQWASSYLMDENSFVILDGGEARMSFAEFNKWYNKYANYALVSAEEAQEPGSYKPSLLKSLRKEYLAAVRVYDAHRVS